MASSVYVKNPAEDYSLEWLMNFLNSFTGRGHKRSIQTIIRFLGLPEKRRRQKDGKVIKYRDFFKINKATSMELVAAGCFSAIDSAQAKANCVSDEDGNPIGYAPVGVPDIEMRLGEVSLILEVSSAKAAVSDETYQKNLDSALGHLDKLDPPAYCLHITNQEKGKTELRSPSPDRRLVPMSIEQLVNCLEPLNSLIAERGVLSETEMADWLDVLHTASLDQLDLAQATRVFLDNLNSPELDLDTSKDESPGPTF